MLCLAVFCTLSTVRLYDVVKVGTHPAHHAQTPTTNRLSSCALFFLCFTKSCPLHCLHGNEKPLKHPEQKTRHKFNPNLEFGA